MPLAEPSLCHAAMVAELPVDSNANWQNCPFGYVSV